MLVMKKKCRKQLISKVFLKKTPFLCLLQPHFYFHFYLPMSTFLNEQCESIVLFYLLSDDLIKQWFTIVLLSRPFIVCHGPCLVTFFPKNNQRMAPMESPMMATSPLFSATITTGHPRRTYIRAPSEYFPYSNTTNKTCILIIVITNQHHVLSTTAQPEPHHAPHMFHVPGQSHRACTSSRGHELRSPQGLARFYVGILRHSLEYKSPHYMFILLPYALHVNSLYVYVLSLYKYSSLLYVFR